MDHSWDNYRVIIGILTMKEKNLLLSIGINIVITAVEIVVGLLIGSLAIIKLYPLSRTRKRLI